MTSGWWAVWVAASSGLVGCYRHAEVPLERVRGMESGADGQSLVLQLEGGGTQRFAEYDELIAEVDASGGEDAGEITVMTPLRASLDAKTLRLWAPERVHEVARPDVRSITLQKYSPSRPYVVAGAAVGAMVLGAIIGGSSISCYEDEDFCGYGRAFYGGIGGLVGLGAGLAISIPITGRLSSELKVPQGAEPWRPGAD